MTEVEWGQYEASELMTRLGLEHFWVGQRSRANSSFQQRVGKGFKLPSLVGAMIPALSTLKDDTDKMSQEVISMLCNLMTKYH